MEWDEYLYLDVNRAWGGFSLAASLVMDAVFRNVSGYDDRYYNLRPVANLNSFSISVRVKRALFESSFLKKTLISDKMELLLYIGIGLLVFLVLTLKYTNNL